MLAGNTAYNPTAFDSIATSTPANGAASLTFSSIPSTYKHLQIRGIYKDVSTSSAQVAPLYIQFNGDSGNNYSRHNMEGDGATVTSLGVVNTSWMYIGFAGAVSTTGAYGGSIMTIMDYANTTKNKVIRTFAGANGNTTGTNYGVSWNSGVWVNTAAITSVTVNAGNGGFATGTTFALYGIAS
jgi:hypothetical protein